MDAKAGLRFKFVIQTIYQLERSHACEGNAFDAKTDTNSRLTKDARGLKHGRLSADWAGVTNETRVEISRTEVTAAHECRHPTALSDPN